MTPFEERLLALLDERDARVRTTPRAKRVTEAAPASPDARIYVNGREYKPLGVEREEADWMPQQRETRAARRGRPMTSFWKALSVAESTLAVRHEDLPKPPQRDHRAWMDRVWTMR